jgi:4-hydroxy-tetrahydrodipicolinate reductase
MSAPLQVTIFGASGRMGRAVIAAVEESSDTAVKGTTTSSGDPAAALRGADVAIEFALPQATAANLSACLATKRPFVIGTTGHDDAQRAQIAAAAREIAIVMAPNMSLGVNLLLKLVELTAGKLDASYDIEVFEAHHRHKKDAPSGTALALGEAAAAGAGRALADCAVYAREGVTGERKPGTIGFATLRGGDVVGEHTVIFAGTGERVELAHKAMSRQNFAAGALRAARYAAARRARNEPGLASMRDVLGLA